MPWLKALAPLVNTSIFSAWEDNPIIRKMWWYVTGFVHTACKLGTLTSEERVFGIYLDIAAHMREIGCCGLHHDCANVLSRVLLQ